MNYFSFLFFGKFRMSLKNYVKIEQTFFVSEKFRLTRIISGRIRILFFFFEIQILIRFSFFSRVGNGSGQYQPEQEVQQILQVLQLFQSKIIVLKNTVGAFSSALFVFIGLSSNFLMAFVKCTIFILLILLDLCLILINVWIFSVGINLVASGH